MNWSKEQLAEYYKKRVEADAQPFAAMQAAAPAKSKMHNKRVLLNGLVFDSIRESEEYRKLHALAQAGVIRGLLLQPVYMLQEAFIDRDGKRHKSITYRADFEYWKDGERIVVDAKGFRTQVYRIKKKLFLKRYPDVVFLEA